MGRQAAPAPLLLHVPVSSARVAECAWQAVALQPLGDKAPAAVAIPPQPGLRSPEPRSSCPAAGPQVARPGPLRMRLHTIALTSSPFLPMISPLRRILVPDAAAHCSTATVLCGPCPVLTPLLSRFWPQAIESKYLSRFASAQTAENKQLVCRICSKYFSSISLPSPWIFKALTRAVRRFCTKSSAKWPANGARSRPACARRRILAPGRHAPAGLFRLPGGKGRDDPPSND